MDTVNTICWIDIPVLNLERAIVFYSQILNQEVMKIEEHGMSFGLLPHTENNVSGCLSVMENRKPSHNGPLVYINVEGRIDDALDRTQEHGGTVLSPKEQIGPYGHRAIIVDTEGNSVALYSKYA
jgi:predicted enzyme related to lactoylglutathione lyase